MAEQGKLDWQESFRRECGIRRVVILHGNLQDVVPDPTREGHWLTGRDAAAQSLRAAGYGQVVVWDRVNGVSGVDVAVWRAIQSAALRPAANTAGGDADEDYDIGPAVPAASTGPAAARAVSQTLTPDDFFGTVARHLHQPASRDPVAFIVDWSHYLFGTANHLSEIERGWLLRIGAAAREAPVALGLEAIARPQSLLVLLADGALALPPSLYLNNALFKSVAVPLPSRLERRAVLLQLGHVFDLDPPLRPQSAALEDMADALDRLSHRDILSMARLSRQVGTMRPEALVALYRYGTRSSPWEQLDHAKLRSAPQRLAMRVKGQDEAIAAVNQVLVRAYTGLAGLQHSLRQRTPKGVLFFVGPTGVGKTELAKALAQFLFGDDEACLRFDMSEFNHEHADQRLVGAPPGYVGFEEGGQLTNAVRQRPFSLVLFDEIEKAHPRILDKFLQILEDGRLTDGKGETVSFSETVIVFTSNIGAADVRPDASDVRAEFIGHVREHFFKKLNRPELLGRIGESNIVPFNFIRSEAAMIEIARVKLEPLRQRLREKWGIEDLRFDDENLALHAIVGKADRSAGGRGVPNALMTHLFDPLSRFIFSELTHVEGGRGRVLKVVQAGRQAAFDFEWA